MELSNKIKIAKLQFDKINVCSNTLKNTLLLLDLYQIKSLLQDSLELSNILHMIDTLQNNIKVS